MIMTNFGRIGKSFIRSITGVQENYSTDEIIELTDISVCCKCPFFANTSKIQSEYCQNYCTKAKITKIKKKYYNEANRFHLPIKERLSKTQLKQILLYHFLGVDKNGIVKNLSAKEIAKILNCNEKTVTNNNKRLVKLNYILYSKISNDKFSVLLIDYKNYHLATREGGNGGYITMPKNLLRTLLNVNKVNSLRLELRKLIEFDNQNVNSEETVSGEYTYKDIKRFLPDYLRYKKAIEDVISNESKAFDTIIKDNGIAFKLKDIYNPEGIKQKIIEKCEMTFNNYFEKFAFEEKDLTDIFQMSIQYGIEKVKDSLDIVYNTYVLKNRYIYNLGGLIRKVILLKDVS